MKNTLTLLLGILLLYSCSTTSDGSIPEPPENLMGEATSATTIDLTWTDRSTNETGFKIERKLIDGTFEVIGTSAADNATFNDKGLTPGETYVYRVYSYNTRGNSSTSSNELMPITTSLNVTIGTQTWSVKNLDVTAYSDGTPIPQVTDPIKWATLTTGAWCYYNNEPANGNTYGKLYNWYAIAGIYDTARLTNKKLAPTGWHIPSDAEWSTLADFLGGESVAGVEMKEAGTTHWISSASPNKLATNSSGFTALPGGIRFYDGSFFNICYNGVWWSSSSTSLNTVLPHAWSYRLNFMGDYISRFNNEQANGFSVRCIRD